MPSPGDVVFAHSSGWMGKLIRLGERLRWKEHASYWNHACVVSDIGPDGTVWVIQATLKGVVRSPISTVGEYKIVPCPADPSKVVEFSWKQMGDHYGVLSIIATAIDLVTGNWFPSFRRRGTWICSAVTAEALRFGGWYHDFGDIYTVTPAQLFSVI